MTIGAIALLVGYAIITLAACVGVVLLLAAICVGITAGARYYVRRIWNTSINMYDVAAWIKSGRPVWTRTPTPEGSTAYSYSRMVPQDGPATDITYPVPVRVQERLDALIDTAERYDRTDAGEGWLQFAHDLRELQDLLRK